MNALTKYDAARYALQVASSVDEVKDIRDKAEAMAAYARQAKDTELVEWATEIKVRAERRAGQMLAEMPKATGTKGQFAGGNTIVPPEKTAKTLSEIGISKNESSRWQKLAAVSDEQFEHAVAAAKDVAGEVTTAAMLRIEKETRQQNAKPESPAEPAPAPQQTATVHPIQPEHDEAAMQAEMMQDAINEVMADNDRLRNMLASNTFTGDEEEKAALLNRLNDLTEENKQLKILNKGLILARDRVMTENASMRKQLTLNAKKLKAVA